MAVSGTVSPTIKEFPGAVTLMDCGVGGGGGGGAEEPPPPPQPLQTIKAKATTAE
jgi:hypothetical protein